MLGLLGCWQVPAMQRSSVHSLLSGVQAVPSLLAGWAQAPAPLHSSAVHSFASGVHGVPAATRLMRHVPDALQVSGRSHAVLVWLPQALPAALKASGGHALELPLQVSGTSQSVAAGRQRVPAGSFASPGQGGPVPVQ